MKTFLKIVLPLLAVLFALSTCKKTKDNPNDPCIMTASIDTSNFSHPLVTLTAVPVDGLTPYTYAWSSGETGRVITAVTYNTSVVTVTDAAGCTATATQEALECTADVTDIDGNTYPVVRIGNQCWTTVNLRTTHFRDGTPIFEAQDSATWTGASASSNPLWCDYQNTPGNDAIYGKLYNYYALTSTHNIAPDGWHVPTEDEYLDLFNNLPGGLGGDGGHLKAVSSLWNPPNTGADNSSGFTALPGGLRFENGLFSNLGFHGLFWTSTQLSSTVARYFILKYDDALATPDQCLKTIGISVRLVHD